MDHVTREDPPMRAESRVTRTRELRPVSDAASQLSLARPTSDRHRLVVTEQRPRLYIERRGDRLHGVEGRRLHAAQNLAHEATGSPREVGELVDAQSLRTRRLANAQREDSGERQGHPRTLRSAIG